MAFLYTIPLVPNCSLSLSLFYQEDSFPGHALLSFAADNVAKVFFASQWFLSLRHASFQQLWPPCRSLPDIAATPYLDRPSWHHRVRHAHQPFGPAHAATHPPPLDSRVHGGARRA